MNSRHKLVLLAVLPVLLVSSAIAVGVAANAERLMSEQSTLVENAVLTQRRAELENYLQLATTAIDHFRRLGEDEAVSKKRAADLLREMNYGADGYFYVYDFEGVNLVHPRMPQLEGTNIWNLRDPDGVAVIQRLTGAARAGGDFVFYQWQKPSTGKLTRKLGYARAIADWGWMLGSGIYLDDLERTTARLRDNISDNIRQSMIGLTVVAILASLLVYAGGMSYSFHELRKADRKIAALARQIVASQEAERCRVARELHDGVSQRLVSAKYRIEMAQRRLPQSEQQSCAELQQGIDSLAEAVHEIRSLSHDLRPRLLDKLGLSAALRKMGEEFAARTGITCDLECDEAPDGVAADSLLALFRVAQESLANIERHAGASSVLIKLRREGGWLRLTIADNGRGFNVAAAEKRADSGIGIANMRERMAHHGGRLDISADRGGVIINAALPLPTAPTS